MAAFYEEEVGGRRPQRKRKSRWLILLDLVSQLLSVVVAVAGVLTFIAPYIHPGGLWIFPVLALAAPVVYLMVVLFALYWIVRWRWRWASVMLLLVVIGLFKMSLFFRPEVRRVYDETECQPKGAIRFMTYNIRQFYTDDGHNSADSLLRFIEEAAPDIVCLQEFNPVLAQNADGYSAFMENYPYVSGGAQEDPRTAPLAIFSKYRILHSGLIRGEVQDETIRESIWADLRIGNDTVRIFNNHLHSTAITADDNEFITNHRYITDSAREDKIRSIVRRFRQNSILRAAEADSLAVAIATTPHARIVCGDFNDTPMSYVYRTMAYGLRDAFRECGRGYSYTFRGFFNTLRIDYVLVSEAFEPLTYEVPAVDWSDHRPVVVQLSYTPSHPL